MGKPLEDVVFKEHAGPGTVAFLNQPGHAGKDYPLGNDVCCITQEKKDQNKQNVHKIAGNVFCRAFLNKPFCNFIFHSSVHPQIRIFVQYQGMRKNNRRHLFDIPKIIF